MKEIDEIRRRLEAAHPREQPELYRQAIGWVMSRMNQVLTDTRRTKEECFVEAVRNGEHPARDFEPVLDPVKDRNYRLYRTGAKAALVIDGVLTTFYGAAVKPFGSWLLGALIGIAMTVGFGYATWAWVKPTFARLSARRLQVAAMISGLVAVIATVIALLPFRGARDPYLETIVPPAVLVLNISFALFAGLVFELAEREAQLRTRTYLAAVSLHAAFGLFLEELRRKLRDHPFNHFLDDDEPENPSRVVACFLAGVLLAGSLVGWPVAVLADTTSFGSCHIIADTTGSVDPLSLRCTVEILSELLPAFVRSFDFEWIEISGWCSTSRWGPPTESFEIPQSDIQDEPGASTLLASIIPSMQEARDSERKRVQVEADSLRLFDIERACAAGPAPLLRKLAAAPCIPEASCSPLNDLLARCSHEPPTRLDLVLTDALDNCDSRASVPLVSSSRTVVIVLPAKGEKHGAVSKRIQDLRARAPWLIILPALELDHGGLWISRLKALLESRSQAPQQEIDQ